MNARTKHLTHSYTRTRGVIVFGFILFLAENFDPTNRIYTQRARLQKHFPHILIAYKHLQVQTNHRHRLNTNLNMNKHKEIWGHLLYLPHCGKIRFVHFCRIVRLSEKKRNLPSLLSAIVRNANRIQIIDLHWALSIVQCLSYQLHAHIKVKIVRTMTTSTRRSIRTCLFSLEHFLFAALGKTGCFYFIHRINLFICSTECANRNFTNPAKPRRKTNSLIRPACDHRLLTTRTLYSKLYLQ